MTKRIDETSASLCAAVADEIRHARDLIEGLATQLVSDERFVTDYLDALQAFDLIIQHMDESADLLGRVADGHDIAGALARIRLNVMQHRLNNALAGE
ncbi:hypothetical protein [Sphingobium boeckii]|uniref:PhoU domain-containing protein n=1 Tax=Sphingobium boeckii TaxID=1082345 RepID=A0A7W9AH12_9SPHN|nr:hypothetical protein [Sphingobium boeckii]MBB5685231.1 hypothetical protein [Sphingobium boeckii]